MIQCEISKTHKTAKVFYLFNDNLIYQYTYTFLGALFGVAAEDSESIRDGWSNPNKTRNGIKNLYFLNHVVCNAGFGVICKLGFSN